MTYEIRDLEGRCLYRGSDLELACEIHDQDPGAHLVICPSATGTRLREDLAGEPWCGPRASTADGLAAACR